MYKTNDFPRFAEQPKDVRFLYVYQDPVKVAASIITQVRQRDPWWFEAHACKLNAVAIEPEKLLVADILQLERNFDAWLERCDIQLLGFRFDRNLKLQSAISYCVG